MVKETQFNRQSGRRHPGFPRIRSKSLIWRDFWTEPDLVSLPSCRRFCRYRLPEQGPMEHFYGIRRPRPYVCEQVSRAKAAARNAGADIIDLGMGNPDLPSPPHVIEKLKETLGKPRTDRYSASRGITGPRQAQAAYYGRRFGVKLNPETQIVATLGSKEGFANVAQAITAPGDVVLCPNPSYPIHAFGFLMAGGVIRSVPSEPTPQFFEAVERAIIHSIPKPLALVVCYPSNPTAYVADLDFYKDLV